MKAHTIILGIICFLTVVYSQGGTIIVDPDGGGDYTTIQAAIDVAEDTDVVQVRPGTYQEAINFSGKNITVASLDPEDADVVAATVIDGNGLGSVVTFNHGEANEAVLTGFTITGGTGTFAMEVSGTDLYWGGGICCENASPTIVRNVIAGNHGPLEMAGDVPVVASFGGGIVCVGGGPTISRNIIKDNSAYAGAGVMVISEGARIVSNLIYRNSALVGGGATLLYGGELVANTIAANEGEEAGGICLFSTAGVGMATVSSSIVCNTTDGGGVYADSNSQVGFQYNNVCNNSPGDYLDTPDLTGVAGNICADPCFVGAKTGEPPKAPIAHWKFDEGTGGIAYDSASNNDSTIYGAAWTAGKIGDYALEFDGDGDYVLGSSSPFGFENTKFTVCGWFKTAAVQCGVMISEGCYQGGWSIGSGGGGYDGKMKVLLKRAGSTNDAYSAITQETYNDNVWHHIAAVITTDTSNSSGNNADIYVDGQPASIIEVQTHPYGSATDNWRIGARPTLPGYFTGQIDDIRIYDRALSATEIRQFYQMDYHLLPGSPCVNAGDPDYVAGPNEKDLGGLPRVFGGRIDMGAYEFYPNRRPVAVAGPNQTGYAGHEWVADVNLDGSGSYDDDGDVLDYYWSWTIDDHDYEANGVAPMIRLPVGEHQIMLVVDDGVELSGPDYCTITVVEPIVGELKIVPRALNAKSKGNWIRAMLAVPVIPGEQINGQERLRLHPGDIEAEHQRFFKRGKRNNLSICAITWFDRQQVIDALEASGEVQVSIVGKYVSGRFFYGQDVIRVKHKN